MGWKSTICLTREQTEGAVQRALDLGLSILSDEQLADLLELLRGGDDHGHNYSVVPEGQEDGRDRGED